MKNIHCLVLCNNSFWTTRDKLDYRGCAIKLCYLGGGIFKEIAPKFHSESVKFGTKKKNFSVEKPQESWISDPLSTELNVGRSSDNLDENPSGSTEQECAVDQPDTVMQEDLEGTGILPDTDAVETSMQNSIETSVEESVQNQAGPTPTESDSSVETKIDKVTSNIEKDPSGTV